MAKMSRDNTSDASFGDSNEGFSGAGTGARNPGTGQSWFASQVVPPERNCAVITSADWIASHSGRSLWLGEAAGEGKTFAGEVACRHQGGKALVVHGDGRGAEMTIKATPTPIRT